MSKQTIRRTEARTQERDRRRAEQERNQKLKWQIRFAAAGGLILLAVAYFASTSFKPSQPATTGVNGPHFQVDTEKIDLGDQALGNTVHASFDVKNSGDGTLTLNPAGMATVLEGC